VGVQATAFTRHYLNRCLGPKDSFSSLSLNYYIIHDVSTTSTVEGILLDYTLVFQSCPFLEKTKHFFFGCNVSFKFMFAGYNILTMYFHG